MLTVVDLRGDAGDPLARLPRAAVDRDLARETVREVIAAVRAGGDAAALEQQERFGARPPSLRVPVQQIEAACGARIDDKMNARRDCFHACIVRCVRAARGASPPVPRAASRGGARALLAN